MRKTKTPKHIEQFERYGEHEAAAVVIAVGTAASGFRMYGPVPADEVNQLLEQLRATRGPDGSWLPLHDVADLRSWIKTCNKLTRASLRVKEGRRGEDT